VASLNIFGTGGFGREILAPCLAERDIMRGLPNPCFDDVSFVDDNFCDLAILGIPVRLPNAMAPNDYFVLAVGSGSVRHALETRCLDMHLKPYTLVSRTAVIGPDVLIGEGGVFCDFTMVTASAVIGVHFQCNIYSYVAHDCVIGDYVTFAPRVCCNGNVHIEDYAYIGTGAVIKQGTPDKPLVIGKGAVVGMGAIVTKDVPAGATVVGNPARVKM
jgi:sugar O-acyltransferase (sialic acid O-acetyltransferase NeuD family)